MTRQKWRANYNYILSWTNKRGKMQKMQKMTDLVTWWTSGGSAAHATWRGGRFKVLMPPAVHVPGPCTGLPADRMFWRPHNGFPFVISFVSTPDRDNRLLNKKFEFLSQPWYPAVVFASLCLNYLLSTMLWDHMDMFFSFCSFILPTIPIYCLYCCIDVFLGYGALLSEY